MSTERELARRVWGEGLVDPQELLGEAEPPVPERYVLEREIGRGGGGRVYLARDADLQRPVALKYLNDASPGDLERFRREARFTARLNDPSIVQIYEMGEVGGAAYIAMQYVDGTNLRDAALSTEALVRALRSVARALERAHDIGIVHRDIKPENILLDGDGNAYLTDFGIARDLSGTLGATMSREGQIMGTPGLMPPEQARGEPHAVDSRSDVYALGATLYVQLTGRYPFEAENIVEVLHAIIHAEPPLPRAHDPSIPRALEAIAMKCLAKDRGERYQGMGEVITAFDGFLAGHRGAADGNAWFRRLVGKQESAPPPPDPVKALEDTTFHRGMEVVREISAWDADLYRVSGSLERSFARLDGIGAKLEEILEASPEAAWARFYRGVVHFRRGRLEDALEDMERAIDRVKDLAGAYFELGRLYLVLHLREQRMARKHIIQPGVQMGLEQARRRLEQAKVAFQEARAKRGDLLPWHEDYAEAVTRLADCDYDACVEVCDRILREEPDLEEVWKLRGDAQCLGGGEPFESYQRAVDVRRSYFEAFHAIGEAHLDRGQFDEARVALERAVRIHAGFAEARALLARLALPTDGATPDEDELERGVEHAREALALDRHSYAGVVALAQLQLELGRLRGNRTCLAEALTTLDRASELDGCQNRVNLMRADALLARVALANGEAANGAAENGGAADAEADLERVRTYLDQATARTDEDGPWGDIRARLAEHAAG